MDLLEFGAPPLMGMLPDRLRTKLHEAANAVRYGDGQRVHGRGEVKPGLSIVRSGAVRIGNIGSDGAWMTTSVLGPGQSFGEFTLITDLPRTHDAVAVGETLIDQISRPAFEGILEDEPALERMILKATTQRLHVMLEFLEDLRRLPLPVHTAKLVHAMAIRAKSPGHVKCNQDELAFTLGVSRVSIGKALGLLQKEGVIRLGYGQIAIPDIEQLADWIAARTFLSPLNAG